MTKKALLTGTLTALLAVAAYGADIAGKWTAEITGRNGQARTSSFVFEADGDKLTGKMTGPAGREFPITDGKVAGETVSFSVTTQNNGNERKTNYTGTIAGDEIKMKATMEGGQGRTQEFTAKRVK